MIGYAIGEYALGEIPGYTQQQVEAAMLESLNFTDIQTGRVQSINNVEEAIALTDTCSRSSKVTANVTEMLSFSESTLGEMFKRLIERLNVFGSIDKR